METSKSNIIKTISEELDCGSNCYYNPHSHDIITIPNLDQAWDVDEIREAFKAELQKVNAKKTAYIKIEALKSYESYKIMEDFIMEISDQKFREELATILERRKPFQKYKNRIDESEYRQRWFDFKQRALEEIVASRLSH